MTLVDIIVLGLFVNFACTVILVVTVLVLIFSTSDLTEINNITQKPQKPVKTSEYVRYLIPYSGIMVMIWFGYELHKFTNSKKGNMIDFVNYLNNKKN